MAGTTANALNISSSGLIAFDGTSAFTGRTVTGTANQIAVTDGSGVSGNPTLSLTSNIYVSGISFNSGSNILSTYITGTFTPVLSGSSTAGTYTYVRQIGYYQIIGTYVTVQVNVAWSAKGTAAGNQQITGFPYTSHNTAGLFWASPEYWGTDSDTLATGSGNLPSSLLPNNQTFTTLTTYSQTGGGRTVFGVTSIGSVAYQVTYST